MFVADGGVMDVAHPILTMTPHLGDQRLFETADIFRGVLDLQFRLLRQRPIAHAELAPGDV
jgi:hypothetical protein